MNYNINKSNNQVPKGYKKTKVGVVPEDWEKLELNKIFDISSKKFNPKIESMNKKCIELEHLSQITGELLGFTNSEEQQSSKNIFKKGQILYGKLRPYLRKYLKTTFDGVCSTEIWVLNNKKVTTDYLFQFVQTDKFNQIANVSTGSKMPRADWKYMSEIPFIIPPIKEQQKIANILTTWDDAISQQEELIKAKEELKKGLMQKLLSGEVRFDGFNREWKNRKIEELVFYQEGPGVRRTQYTKSGVKLLNVGNLNNNELNLNSTDKYISENEAFGNYKHFLADEGDLLISCSGINSESFKKKIAFVKKEHLPLCMNTSTMRFKSLDNQLSLNYLNYFFQTLDFEKQVFKVLTGSAQFNFGPTHIKWFKIPLPSMKEQLKIDQILATIDKEIDLLKNELEELKKQKKGLMQKLLTGEVRVKV